VVLVGKESTQLTFDFSAFDGGIEQDLGRRDFTIDAMAVELNQLVDNLPGVKLIDPFGGWDDLRNGIIRVVAETVFASDAVRLLRGVRLAAELGFRIDEATETLIKRDAYLVNGVAGERIREELLRLLARPGAGRSLDYLDKLGLLTSLFPELLAAKGVEQPKEHFWDVFTHLLRTVEAVEFLLRQGTWEYDGESALAAVPWSPELAEHFSTEVSHGSTRRSLLKLAGLLHDVSKPETKTIEAGGRMRFLGHGKGGATVAARILERLRFSSREIKLIETEVMHHLRPGQMSQDELPTRRAIYRYFRDTGDAGVDILYLSLADHLATRGPDLDLENWRQHGELVAYVLSRRFREEVRPLRLIDGNDLINVFGLSPGPEIGRILEVVKEAQASGEITAREEALNLAGRLLTSKEAGEIDNGEEE
jgi:poly(A) polymerase